MAATREPAAAAAVGAAGLLPAILVQPFAGLWADRWTARRVIRVAAVTRAIALALAAIALLADQGGTPQFSATALIVSSGWVVHAITTQTIVPPIAGGSELDRINARVHAIEIGGQLLVGPLLGAAIVGLAAAAAFTAAAGCFLAAGGLAVGLPRERKATASPTVPQRWAVLAGLAWLARHPLLLTVTLLTGASTIAYNITWPILTLYATGPLALSPAETGARLEAFAVGPITAAPLAHRVRARACDRGLLIGVGVVQSAAYAAIGVVPSTPVTAVALWAIGASATMANTALASLRQTHAPPLLLGRVIAASRTIIAAASPAAALAGGALATSSLRAPPLASATLLVIAVAVSARAFFRTG